MNIENHKNMIETSFKEYETIQEQHLNIMKAEQLPDLKEKFVFVKDLSEAAAFGYDYLKGTGGVVLLAPACASFDMFDNFEHRGDVFKRECSLLKEKVVHG